MNKRDIMELRKRFKKEECTITRVAGCYVDINGHKVVKLNQNFLNLPDEEFYKYLEIAKKTMAGSVGNNILEVDFLPQEGGNEKQQFLLGLRESELKNEELLDRLYDIIIESYESLSNYLILVFHDCYDIMKRTSDNLKLDESEEVYDYLLISICPVELSKAALGYRKEDNRIGARVRDFVVGAPATGFLFPAFSDGMADVTKIDYFLKDAKDSRSDFIMKVLGCGPKRTSTEKQKAFAKVIEKAYPEDIEKAEDVIMDFRESFKKRVAAEEEVPEELEDSAPVVLSSAIFDEIIRENHIEETPARVIKEVFREEFEDELPVMNNLIDEKAVAKTVKKKEALSDVVLRVTPGKAGKIKTETIDDQKYLLIPIEDDEQLLVNGSVFKVDDDSDGGYEY